MIGTDAIKTNRQKANQLWGNTTQEGNVVVLQGHGDQMSHVDRDLN